MLPLFLDQEVVQQAQVALTCPATMDRIASYKDKPWSLKRFRSSLRQSFGFTDYRISRIPEYEIQRCGLDDAAPNSAEVARLRGNILWWAWRK